MSDCFLCAKKISTTATGVGSAKPYATAVAALHVKKMTAVGTLKVKMIRERAVSSNVGAIGLLHSAHPYSDANIAAVSPDITKPILAADVNLAGTWDPDHIRRVAEGEEYWDNFTG